MAMLTKEESMKPVEDLFEDVAHDLAADLIADAGWSTTNEEKDALGKRILNEVPGLRLSIAKAAGVYIRRMVEIDMDGGPWITVEGLTENEQTGMIQILEDYFIRGDR